MEEGAELFITSGQTFSFRNLPKPLLEVVRRQFGRTAPTNMVGVVNDNNTEIQIPLTRYSEFIQVLRTKTEKISHIPNAVLAALERAQHVVLPSRETLLGWVSEKLLDSLYDYQKEGVAFTVARGGKCMIADEMGVGKSRQGKKERGT
jgi:SNF2 family DNA or RNA helicase